MWNEELWIRGVYPSVLCGMKSCGLEVCTSLYYVEWRVVDRKQPNLHTTYYWIWSGAPGILIVFHIDFCCFTEPSIDIPHNTEGVHTSNPQLFIPHNTEGVHTSNPQLFIDHSTEASKMCILWTQCTWYCIYLPQFSTWTQCLWLVIGLNMWVFHVYTHT
jgi:hypothetical protein